MFGDSCSVLSIISIASRGSGGIVVIAQVSGRSSSWWLNWGDVLGHGLSESKCLFDGQGLDNLSGAIAFGVCQKLVGDGLGKAELKAWSYGWGCSWGSRGGYLLSIWSVCVVDSVGMGLCDHNCGWNSDSGGPIDQRKSGLYCCC